jgi:hypothetical protein
MAGSAKEMYEAFYPGPLNDGFGKISRDSGGAGSRNRGLEESAVYSCYGMSSTVSGEPD